MTNIFVKETVLETIPHIFGPFVHHLYVEQGQIPCHDLKKTKSATILINENGIYFFRRSKKSTHYLKLKIFTSIYDISQLSYQKKNRINISVQGEPDTFFIADHWEQAVAMLQSMHRLLFKDTKNLPEIPEVNFPNRIKEVPYPYENDISVLSLHYITLYSRIHVASSRIDQNLIETFNKYSKSCCDTLVIDSQCILLDEFKYFIAPLVFLRDLTKIHFKNFAPYCVCNLIHFMAKTIPRVTIFILEGYNAIVPEQLRLDRLESHSPLSFIFKNCSLPGKTTQQLFLQFKESNVELQRLSLIDFKMSTKRFRLLGEVIQSRPFRTMEIFELNELPSTKFRETHIIQLLTLLRHHCRFLSRLAISNWSKPITVYMENFQNFGFLNEIEIDGHTMTHIIPESLIISKRINRMNFSKCVFTIDSLKSLFLNLSKRTHNVSLSLADLQIESMTWSSFYSELRLLTPVKCLKELDWSGNLLTTSTVQAFFDFFFQTKSILFLKLDRLFNLYNLDTLEQLLGLISKTNLFGLSINGYHDRNFTGKGAELVTVLKTNPNLAIIHLNDQQFTDTDVGSLISYFQMSKQLFEISCDGTSIGSHTVFYNFYQGIYGIQSIESVCRPVKDLDRLFSQEDITTPAFDRFASQMCTKNNEMSDCARSILLCRFLKSEIFDKKLYNDIAQRYPEKYFEFDYQYANSFMKKNARRSLPSLFNFQIHSKTKDLAELHNKFLIEPTHSDPYCTPPSKMVTVDDFTYHSMSSHSEEEEMLSTTLYNSVMEDPFASEPVFRNSPLAEVGNSLLAPTEMPVDNNVHTDNQILHESLRNIPPPPVLADFEFDVNQSSETSSQTTYNFINATTSSSNPSFQPQTDYSYSNMYGTSSILAPNNMNDPLNYAMNMNDPSITATSQSTQNFSYNNSQNLRNFSQSTVQPREVKNEIPFLPASPMTSLQKRKSRYQYSPTFLRKQASPIDGKKENIKMTPSMELFNFFKEKAEKGDVNATLAVANHYMNGSGTQQNVNEAVRLYQEAVDKGNVEALYQLGQCYQNGKGVIQNDAEAFRYYKLGAEKDHVESILSLGYCYFNGVGTPIDYHEAFLLYERASQHGDAYASFRLGLMYLIGQGVTKNDVEAFKYMQIALDRGYNLASINLGIFYLNGTGTPKNDQKAFEMFKVGSDHGLIKATEKLGECYLNGIGVQVDRIEGIRLLQIAARSGDVEACYNLATIYDYSDDVTVDPSQAVVLLQTAADARYKDATYLLALHYEEGNGVPVNYQKAIEYFSIAASQNITDAFYHLGLCYEFGQNDMAKAISYYEAAANYNVGDAMDQLGLCYLTGNGVMKDEEKAVQLFEKAALQASIEGRYHLAACHVDGVANRCDYEGAIVLLEMLSNIHHADAIFYLGRCHEFGLGVPVNSNEAIRLYQVAASLGCNDAVNRLQIVTPQTLA